MSRGRRERVARLARDIYGPVDELLEDKGLPTLGTVDYYSLEDTLAGALAQERRLALEEAIGVCYGLSEQRGFANAGRFCDALRALLAQDRAGEGEGGKA